MTRAATKAPTLWAARITTTDEAAPAFEAALTEGALSVSSYEVEEWAKPRPIWRVEALFEEKPAAGELSARAAIAAASLGIAEPDIEIASLPPRNWLEESYQSFPPLRAGKFYVYGDHISARPPAAVTPIRLNAATAFGSGEHESTYGCLLALSGFARRAKRRRPLDLGCGSGILAIAMAKTWRCKVVAADIDPEAVRVTALNAAKNQCAALIAAGVSDSCTAPVLRKRGPYDVITANILARPLTRMARDLAPLLGRGGRLIMAGLLRTQEEMVLGAYRRLGLKLERRYRLGAWTTLVLAR